MRNKTDLNRIVLEGLCLKCFYLNFEENGEKFVCANYKIELDGLVDSCPGFMVISEGLSEMIRKMKSNGELPEWVGK